MAQVRPIIDCFCQILSKHGFSKLSSETFRLAKFDQPEAAAPLWRLLFEMLYYSKHEYLDENIVSKKFTQTSKADVIHLIKCELFQRGYTYDNFLDIKPDMKHGSRQLLVCVGWLIYHLKLMEIFIHNATSQSNILENEDTSVLHQELLSNMALNENLPAHDIISEVKWAINLNNKLRYGLRRVYHLSIEKTKLQHEIHSRYRLSDKDISSLEAHLCQNPDLLENYVSLLDDENGKLQLFLFWKQKEDIFWKWMESVLDQTAPTPVSSELTTNENDENIDEMFVSLASLYDQMSTNSSTSTHSIEYKRLQAEKQRFNAALDTLDTALVRLELLWKSEHGQVLLNDFETIVDNIDNEVSNLFCELLSTGTQSVDQQQQHLYSQILNDDSNPVVQRRLIFEPQSVKHVSSNSSGNEESRFIKPIECESIYRSSHVNELKHSISRKEQQQKAQLTALTNQFENGMIIDNSPHSVV
ncbi:unnamed protein product [Didymodactylos carnosus]|uniref:Tubulin epsilon and delta complex protein 1 domain-containing protein n=1 Tax=Didymodactylos carnosus TaxID=1234261 RepID=A0A813QYI4_9BILA|nr:unnamed protein product [Didymodactylos carnosus]CAF0836870.1 unnamed protein product [Didymodactylos carnosus]CAF3557816.1 unnamed protein product [Didymodactylos carnosus]CAF3621696.1 unnamed protein product [Didymodactylos carnosus]